MTRALLCAALAASLWGQQFEVASVKPMGPVSGGDGRGSDAPGGIGSGCDASFPKFDGKHFTVTTTPFALITWAYGYNKTWGCSYTSMGGLIMGGPGWIRSERFQVEGVVPDGSPQETLDQFMKGDAPALEKMLQGMLAERFKLVVHRETKPVSAYALELGKGGSKVKPAEPDEKRMLGIGRRENNGRAFNAVTGRKVEMRDFAFLLLLNVHEVVVDRTGLTGEYDFDLNFAPFDAGPGVDSAYPSLFTAIQEQLGLKLERTKAPLEGVVIDHAEKPSDN